MTDQVIDQPEALDMILEYLVQNKGESKSFRQIHKDIFDDQPVEIFLHLTDVIINFNDNLVEGRIHDGYGDWPKEGHMTGTAITEHFLRKQGGFKKWYADQKNQRELETTERELTIKSLSDQMVTNKINRIGIVISLVVSAIALIISILALLKD